MKTQEPKTFKIESRGVLPNYTKKIVDELIKKEVSRDTVFVLSEDITFCVVSLGEAHGNLNKVDKSAWLAPRNGDNSWNVSITWK